MGKHGLFILGAGDGGRLGRGIPKPLVELAGHRLLDMQLAMFQTDDWHIVGGYKSHLYSFITDKVLENPSWEDGIITSYQAIYDAASRGGYEYLTCVDGDLIFSRAAARHLMKPGERILLVSSDCTEAVGLNNYGVSVDSGVLSPGPPDYIWGCAITLTLPHLKKIIDKDGGLDLFIPRLWGEGGFEPVVEQDIYIEVDTPEDLEAAQHVFY